MSYHRTYFTSVCRVLVRGLDSSRFLLGFVFLLAVSFVDFSGGFPVIFWFCGFHVCSNNML